MASRMTGVERKIVYYSTVQSWDIFKDGGMMLNVHIVNGVYVKRKVKSKYPYS